MAKVYVVTHGEYADYRILAIFSKREYATAYCRANKGLNNAIETYELDIPAESYVKTYVRMKYNGTVLETWESPNDGELNSGNWDIKGNFYMEVATADLERAIKVVNEKRGMLIAENRWQSKPSARLYRE